MLIDDLTQLPHHFKEGYRGIMLLCRNKDGQVGNAQRKCFKKITKGVSQWNEAVEKFKHLRDTAYPTHRIYASVNSRNMPKAIHEFKRRQLEFDYGNNQELDEFYRDIENRFFSCLMNPSCRETSYFLIDCDTEQEYEKAIDRISPELIIFDYATKSGRHIITHPFNPNDVKVEVKKDDLIAIGW